MKMMLPSPTISLYGDLEQKSKKKQKTKTGYKQHEKVKVSELSKSSRIQYRQRAFALFEKGYGYFATARILKLSIFTVRDWHRLYKEGFFEPELKKPGNCHSNLLPKEIKEKVREEYEAGVSVTSLCTKYGKSKSTIRYWLKQQNS